MERAGTGGAVAAEFLIGFAQGRTENSALPALPHYLKSHAARAGALAKK